MLFYCDAIAVLFIAKMMSGRILLGLLLHYWASSVMKSGRVDRLGGIAEYACDIYLDCVFFLLRFLLRRR
ncbi:hypothetical protein Q31b_46920 [Novipirellula aureliae]|uniref:Uncharacterized protein n=1 Tax=Novipirellula aureliae TaxID=2527966 RepID=A0A5C6DKK6_9BACT|nr:hypothetical protein Q31b_46920 [Novipirellula aureliae]